MNVYRLNIFKLILFLNIKGGNQADLLVLGDVTQVSYLGQGNLDYALIDDFKLEQFDKIQLKVSASNYSLGTESIRFAKRYWDLFWK